MSFGIRASVFAAGLLLVTGCAQNKTNNSPFPSISEQSRARIDARVNCSTAQRDIRVLEDERASVGRQVLAGARSVFPIAAVGGILSNDYDDRVAVATGQYNADIERKIDQIKRTCGIR